MSTLDDKLLGEKTQNYCSSSSEDDDDDVGNDERMSSKKSSGPKFIPEAKLKEQSVRSGSAHNTGPKGVIQDWQRFKQLEHEKNMEAQQERVALAKKLAFTCMSDDLDKEIEKDKELKSVINKKKDAKNQEDLDQELLDDEFLNQYINQRYEEMRKKALNLPRFGNVIELTNDRFLDEIDKENKSVTIIIHIYDQKLNECKTMNECLEKLAQEYVIVKFCRVKSTEISLSDKFRKMGCPALLVYKNSELIGNFVRLGDEFGSEFCSSDVENFLIEQGFLPSQDIITTIRGSGSVATAKSQNESDDD